MSNFHTMAKVENIKLEEFIEKMTATIANTMINTKKIHGGENKNKFILSSPIEFELAVIVKKKAKGKINVLVVEAGGNYEQKTISRIKFQIDSLGNINNNYIQEGLKNLGRSR